MLAARTQRDQKLDTFFSNPLPFPLVSSLPPPPPPPPPFFAPIGVVIEICGYGEKRKAPLEYVWFRIVAQCVFRSVLLSLVSHVATAVGCCYSSSHSTAFTDRAKWNAGQEESLGSLTGVFIIIVITYMMVSFIILIVLTFSVTSFACDILLREQTKEADVKRTSGRCFGWYQIKKNRTSLKKVYMWKT